MMIQADFDAAIDDDWLIRSCQDIVRCPSETHDEARAADLTRTLMVELGYDDAKIDRNGNVIGTISGRGNGPSVMLNGHLDHVPAGDMTDPFSGALVDAARWGETGQAIYGRGTCDMKANVVTAVFAAAAVKRAGLRPGGDIVVVADVEEEIDSPKGVKSVVEDGLRTDYGISVEATNGAVCLGHRGKIEFEAAIKGRTCHASEPNNGVNAIFQALPYLRAVEEAAVSLGHDDFLGAATMTVTGLHSHPDNGSAIVPDRCVMRVDRRYVRGETAASCEAELRSLFRSVASDDPAWDLALVNHYPLMYTEPDTVLVDTTIRAVQQMTGQRPAVTAWRFGVNGTFMADAGIPTVGLGPGNEIWAHTPDEHILVDDVLTTARTLASLVAMLTKATTV